MLKFGVVVIAALAVCWGFYMYVPETTHVIGHLPRVGTPITGMMMIGGLVTFAFWRIVSGK